jgi:transcriptional regulator with XRE-family HTH domain
LTFHELIRTAREGRGLSREAVARRIGVNAATVAAWEYGHKAPPGDERLAMLAKVVRLPLADVVGAAVKVRPYMRVPCGTHADRALAAALLVWMAGANDDEREAMAAHLKGASRGDA